MPFQVDEYIFDHLAALERMVGRALRSRLDPYDVRPGQIPVLRALQPTRTLSQKELLNTVPVEQPTLANTLRRMSRDGLISSRRRQDDRRTVLYALTEKGLQAHGVASAAQEDLRRVCEHGLTRNDLRYFRKILSQMTQHIEKDLNEPALFLADVVDTPRS
ncbi:MarR family winged helix-turn-helix transcriptional regulator [Pseudodesulfovibrio senegalensis]|uniref:Winged helix-turn-helix transcriptional regulator n=1 Tax=Pseudodesulfovibrio senegalensis TaxID=1721087 RepID=A0A6N6MYZ5_9BACT|nr:MarR family winged helix-turn-helix transcriptional regulator [Pseudodesulfovibrio senegalensis]KAB1440855.1 winged helix-turn-helix transcriptional regulator [Pseudodesulfovibrio senegalensis]